MYLSHLITCRGLPSYTYLILSPEDNCILVNAKKRFLFSWKPIREPFYNPSVCLYENNRIFIQHLITFYLEHSKSSDLGPIVPPGSNR